MPKYPTLRKQILRRYFGHITPQNKNNSLWVFHLGEFKRSFGTIIFICMVEAFE